MKPTSKNAVEAMMNPNLFTRRHALKSMACGFGYLALAGMAAERAFAANRCPDQGGEHSRERISVVDHRYELCADS